MSPANPSRTCGRKARGVTVLAQSAGGLGVPVRELGLLVLGSAVITFLVTGIVRVLAIRFGAMAVPRQRDVHVIPVPRLGGVGMYLGVRVRAIAVVSAASMTTSTATMVTTNAGRL